MANPQAIPAESTALNRVLDAIDELELNRHVVELETHGFTTIEGAIPTPTVTRAKAAILDRFQRQAGCEVDEQTATSEDVEGMTYHCCPINFGI